MQFQAKVLTVSDGVIAGTREDRSGDALVDRLVHIGYHVAERRCVEDGVATVSDALLAMTSEFWGLVVTTGGTGFSQRDLTPEGTLSVIERSAPGLAEAMRAVSPLGRLSRGVTGVRGDSIIVNVPGSPRGALENLGAIEDVLQHALMLLLDSRTEHPNAGG